MDWKFIVIAIAERWGSGVNGDVISFFWHVVIIKSWFLIIQVLINILNVYNRELIIFTVVYLHGNISMIIVIQVMKVNIIEEYTGWWYHASINVRITKVRVGTTEAGITTTLLQKV